MSIRLNDLLDYLDQHLIRDHDDSPASVMKALENAYTANDGACTEGELTAFSQGVAVGMQIMTEIRVLP